MGVKFEPKSLVRFTEFAVSLDGTEIWSISVDIDRYRFWNPTKKNTGLFPSKKREIPM